MIKRILLITGKSGTGKTTLMNNLKTELPETIRFIRSITTRPRRPDDSDEDYEFLTLEEFQAARDRGEFLSCEQQRGHWYAFRLSVIEAALADTDHIYVRSITPNVLPIWQAAFPGRVHFLHLGSAGDQELTQRMLTRGDDLVTINGKLDYEESWDYDIEQFEADGLKIHVFPSAWPTEEALAMTIRFLAD